LVITKGPSEFYRNNWVSDAIQNGFVRLDYDHSSGLRNLVS